VLIGPAAVSTRSIRLRQTGDVCVCSFYIILQAGTQAIFDFYLYVCHAVLHVGCFYLLQFKVISLKRMYIFNHVKCMVFGSNRVAGHNAVKILNVV